MSPATITVKSVNIVPEADPWQQATGQSSHTVLILDLEDGEIIVRQEYKDNSISMYRWRGLELAWPVPGHPSEDAMRTFIQDYTPKFERVLSGANTVLNGSNWTGSLDEDAARTQEEIQFALDGGAIDGDYYQFWAIEDWLQTPDFAVDASNQELQLLAIDIEMEAADQHIVLDGDILDWLLALRQQLRWEAEVRQEDILSE